jgi:hypothetical protein
MAVVFVVVMLWVPFRAGRRPLALFDQFAAFGIIGVLGAFSVSAQGLSLWVSGSLGLAFGLLSYFIANYILVRVGPPQRAAAAMAAVSLSFLACASATFLFISLGQRLLRA